jgi:DNA modification methylase
MKPTFQENGVEIYQGDCREVLRSLPDESVHCVVTSPPYWGLRDYGTASWEGGDASCQHSVGGQVQDNKAPGAITTGQRPGVDASRCKTCGATRIDRQIGLEDSPVKYIATMREVFAEVRRVLRSDGTLWLNMGDSYCGPNGRSSGGQYDSTTLDFGAGTIAARNCPTNRAWPGLKAKDLVGVPWMLAFALREDGWYLRQLNSRADSKRHASQIGTWMASRN